MTLPAGHILKERYRVVSILGQGGMSVVYRAWDLILKKPVALKELSPQTELDIQPLAHWKEQFQLEAQVLARLDHPNLVDVTDFFHAAGRAYLVMKFVEGQSLQSLIDEEGALSESLVLQWADQLLDSLSYCHAHGVIHRDIKPANIIVRPDGKAKLVDFGLVKMLDPNDPRTRTIMMNMGTPEYAPPEQYDSQPGYTGPWSDIYSLGATLYHALTGLAPPTASQRMVAPSEFRTPSQINPQVSAQTESTILQAMAMERERRFHDAASMAAALAMRANQRSRKVFVVLAGIILALVIALGASRLLGLWPFANEESEVAATTMTAPTEYLTATPTEISTAPKSTMTVAAQQSTTAETIAAAVTTPTSTETVTPMPKATDTPTSTDTPTPTPTDTPSPTPISTTPAPPTTVPLPNALELEDFEYSDVNALGQNYWINAPGNVLVPSLEGPPHAASGQYALAMSYSIRNAPPSDYVGMERQNMLPMDWRNYTHICMWISNNDFSGHLVLQFREQNGEVWKVEIQLRNVLAREFCIPLDESSFFLAEHSSVQDRLIDLAAIDNYAFYLGNGGITDGVVYLDRLELRP
ncbi:MAG: serine/threonine protein kinase [Chloroflexota bacterium]|nr:MAG: serine/threonine protein kinase [Chloroflexota bacterium]